VNNLTPPLLSERSVIFELEKLRPPLIGGEQRGGCLKKEKINFIT